jgi:hypothetical protein
MVEVEADSVFDKGTIVLAHSVKEFFSRGLWSDCFTLKICSTITIIL